MVAGQKPQSASMTPRSAPFTWPSPLRSLRQVWALAGMATAMLSMAISARRKCVVFMGGASELEPGIRGPVGIALG